MNNETSDGGATVPCISLLGGPHLCDTCRHEFATCEARNIVWGIDRDPAARGADADKVLECDAHSPNSPICVKANVEADGRGTPRTVRPLVRNSLSESETTNER